MKWFADDYFTDPNERKSKTHRGTSHPSEFIQLGVSLGWRPSLDLYETEEGLIILVDMAGMQVDEVDIMVDRECVKLRGKRCRPSYQEITRIHRMEIEFGSFEYIVTLPQPVDPNGARSTYDDGFILMRLPKEVKITS